MFQYSKTQTIKLYSLADFLKIIFYIKKDFKREKLLDSDVKLQRRKRKQNKKNQLSKHNNAKSSHTMTRSPGPMNFRSAQISSRNTGCLGPKFGPDFGVVLVHDYHLWGRGEVSSWSDVLAVLFDRFSLKTKQCSTVRKYMCVCALDGWVLVEL